MKIHDYMKLISKEIDKLIISSYINVYLNEEIEDESISFYYDKYCKKMSSYIYNQDLIYSVEYVKESGNLSAADFLLVNSVSSEYLDNSFRYFIQGIIQKYFLEIAIIQKTMINLTANQLENIRKKKSEYFSIDSKDQDNASEKIFDFENTSISLFKRLSTNYFIERKNNRFDLCEFKEDIDYRINTSDYLFNEFSLLYKISNAFRKQDENGITKIPELFSDYIIFYEKYFSDIGNNIFTNADDYIKDAKFNDDLDYESLYKDTVKSLDDAVQFLSKFDIISHFPELEDASLDNDTKLEKIEIWISKINKRIGKNINRNYERVLKKYNKYVDIYNKLLESNDKRNEKQLINNILFNSLLHNQFFSTFSYSNIYRSILKRIDLNYLYNMNPSDFVDQNICETMLKDIYFLKTCMNYNIDLNRLNNVEYYTIPNHEEKIFSNYPFIVDGMVYSNHITIKKMEMLNCIFGNINNTRLINIIDAMNNDDELLLSEIHNEFIMHSNNDWYTKQMKNQFNFQSEIKYNTIFYADLSSYLKMQPISEEYHSNTKYIKPNSLNSSFKRHKFISMYLIHSIYRNKRFFENSRINTAIK